jgi:hypothetical protein
MRPYAIILSMINLRQYQIKHNGIRARYGEFWTTNGNLTNKGWNTRAVRKIMLFCADLLGLVNRIVDDNKHTTE